MFYAWLVFDEMPVESFQVVTVGVVGGSDLTKISEQLGKTGNRIRSSFKKSTFVLRNSILYLKK